MTSSASRGFLRVALVVAAFVCVGAVHAQSSLGELEQAGQFRMRAWLEPESGAVVGQQVLLKIEIATDRWFAGGTRLGLVEIPDAIVLRREKFATNLSLREGAKSWTAQQYTLTIYPQKPQPYTVPPIELAIAIAGEGGAVIEGKISTPALGFEAVVPPGTGDGASWIASPSFSVEAVFDRPLEKLRPGDALSRTVAFEATDVPAMLLPEFPAETIEGVAVYRKTPLVRDDVNRGAYVARREETLTYVIEKAGEYRLPERVYWWWNTRTGSLESRTVPAVVFEAGGAVAAGQPAVPRAPRNAARAVVWAGSALVLALGVAVLLLALRRSASIAPAADDSRRVSVPNTRQLRAAYASALRRGDYPAALTVLYRWYDRYQADFPGRLGVFLEQNRGPEERLRFARLLARLYGGKAEAVPEPDVRGLLALAPRRERRRRAGASPRRFDLNPV